MLKSFQSVSCELWFLPRTKDEVCSTDGDQTRDSRWPDLGWWWSVREGCLALRWWRKNMLEQGKSREWRWELTAWTRSNLQEHRGTRTREWTQWQEGRGFHQSMLPSTHCLGCKWGLRALEWFLAKVWVRWLLPTQWGRWLSIFQQGRRRWAELCRWGSGVFPWRAFLPGETAFASDWFWSGHNPHTEQAMEGLTEAELCRWI